MLLSSFQVGDSDSLFCSKRASQQSLKWSWTEMVAGHLPYKLMIYEIYDALNIK